MLYNEFKTTHNDLGGLRTFSLKDLNYVKVHCTKFEVSIFISFEILLKSNLIECVRQSDSE